MKLSPPLDGLKFFNECFGAFRRSKDTSEANDGEAKLEFLKWVQRRLVKARCYKRALSASERGLLELTIRLSARGLIKVMSRELLSALGLLLMKVKSFIKRFNERLAEEGWGALINTCRIAISWGYHDAIWWLRDRAFAEYLGLVKRSTERMMALLVLK